MTRWIDPSAVDSGALQALGLPLLVAQTLARRGLNDPAEARAFLDPAHLPSVPFPGVEKSVDLILQAIQSRRRICVWGDFDVDGQTSTALLTQALTSLGADVVSYIPIRSTESHGVHIHTLKPLLDAGVQLLLTCDTGITAFEALEYATGRGVTVVLTDHHELETAPGAAGVRLPAADVILNPKLLPETHPLYHLAGVGVAYKLAQALLEAGHAPLALDDLADLAALGLVADVALLKAETRSIVQRGILALQHTQRAGLQALAEFSRTRLETATEETIGFSFAPRLNALGRLDDANPAVEFLLTTDMDRARLLGMKIESLNAQRQMMTRQVFEAAESQLRENPRLLLDPVIVLAHPNWTQGVVGIVASRLVERYHKPVILLNQSSDGFLRGSARSIEGLHITAAIASQKQLLRGFGGHPMAAGLSMPAEALVGFRRGLGRAIEAQLGQVARQEAALTIDAWLDFDQLGLDLAQGIEMLAPFGAGNPALTFATRAVTLQSISKIGQEHLRLAVTDSTSVTRSVIWWGGAQEELPEPLSAPGTDLLFDLAYTARGGSYRGERQLNLQFKEARFSQQAPIPVQLASPLDIIDLRSHAVPALQEWLQQSPEVWAEGADEQVGRGRNALQCAPQLLIYTAPPSLADFRQALKVVQPRTLLIFASPAQVDYTASAEAFLRRLTGLCKYALSHYAGRYSLSGLSAKMASRNAAVELGLQWLSTAGYIGVQVEEDEVLFSPGTNGKTSYVQQELFNTLKGTLAETAAFRAYFRQVDPRKILEMAK